MQSPINWYPLNYNTYVLSSVYVEMKTTSALVDEMVTLDWTASSVVLTIEEEEATQVCIGSHYPETRWWGFYLYAA